LEIVERKFRDTPRGTKKYAKRLTEYINYLIAKERILEAKHFFHRLYEEKPNHTRTIRLGYSLSIASFDNEGVRKFDKLLYDSKPSDIELYWFRLKYYLSLNNFKSLEESCEDLLSKTIAPEYLNTIFEACVHQKSYAIAVNILKYLEREKITLSTRRNKQIKNIALQRFANSLVKIKYV
jgi:hypothetical protein